MLSSPDRNNTTESQPQLMGAQGLGSLEKIRDILFGEYVREFEDRFQALEHRMSNEVERLRGELQEHVSQLEGLISEKEAASEAQFEQVDERFAGADEKRRDLQSEMHASQERLQQALDTVRTELEAQIAVTDEMFRELLQEQSEALFARLSEQKHALEDVWSDTRAQLENKKADRIGLARLFNHIAAHLIDPFEAERSLLYRPDWDEGLEAEVEEDIPEPIIEVTAPEEEVEEDQPIVSRTMPLPQAFDVDLALREAMEETGIEAAEDATPGAEREDEEAVMPLPTSTESDR